jgi:hypothetical protein
MTFNRTRCPHCRKKLQAGQRIHPECIDGFATSQEAKAKREEAKRLRVAARVERVEVRRRKEAIKTRSEWLAEAKITIQKYRRLEELALGSGCMSCGKSQQEVIKTDGWKPGGAWDGGHFLSKGARPELALEPLNIWLQCKSCNAGSGKYAHKGYTVNALFEANLIKRIGIDQVEWLKGPHEPKKYTVDDLKAFISQYREKLKALKEAASD